MEDSEIQKQFQEDNKQISARLERIMENEKWVASFEGVQKTALYESAHSPGIRVGLEAIYQKDDEYDMPKYPPIDFMPPIYCFDYFGRISGDQGIALDPGMRYTTPYGVMPKYVIGPDNKLYEFNAYYYFSGEKAKKYEDIFIVDDDVSDPETKRYIEAVEKIGKIKISKLDRFLEEGDSRFVDLTPGDYELIFGVLEQIESGEFKKT